MRLVGDALDECRRRIQCDSLGRRGRKDDPLYKARRTLRTGAGLLTERQQRMVTAYREPDPGLGKFVMQSVIDSLSSGVPTVLVELRRLGHTLKQRAADVLAFFDRPSTSNGATEAINGRLEHLRGSALGFRNLTNYITRSLLETGGFRPHLPPQMR